jgi:hypothetical protein
MLYEIRGRQSRKCHLVFTTLQADPMLHQPEGITLYKLLWLLLKMFDTRSRGNEIKDTAISFHSLLPARHQFS